VQNPTNLDVYRRSHALSLSVYRATRSFPKCELYGLTSQTRRSAVSIPSNIAEGCGRRGNKEFARFLEIAIGSANELHCQLQLARDLKYLPAAKHAPIDHELGAVKGMLITLFDKVSGRTVPEL